MLIRFKYLKMLPLLTYTTKYIYLYSSKDCSKRNTKARVLLFNKIFTEYPRNANIKEVQNIGFVIQ
jgi:hypothetical protein